jgi:hypothetical protein
MGENDLAGVVYYMRRALRIRVVPVVDLKRLFVIVFFSNLT